MVHATFRPSVEAAGLPTPDEVDAEPLDEPGSVFPQSVASGGPTPTGVVLWTRVAPAAHRADASLSLTVAEDPALERVVLRSAIPAAEFDAAHDHTLRVDLDGELEPDTQYYYRFRYDGVPSRRGRCRTLPAPDASPDRVRLAILSCQHYQNGYFGAYDHVAREDVDFVLHLGDYIYESADQRYRAPTAPPYEGRGLSLPSGYDLAWALKDFRHLYRTYRADPSLQAAHERHTFIRCWDDHAVANNRYWDYERDAPVAPDHPRGDDASFMRQLTAEGIQAWWEYTPARIEYDPDADHLHDAFQLWRQIDIGDLVSLLLTDERLFRSPPPGADGTSRWRLSERRDHPDRTMLGDEQRAWFLDAARSCDRRWTVWGNEVLSMPLRVGLGPASIRPNLDAWDGYAYERDRLLAALATAGNAVTLTGDLHTALAGYQTLPNGARAGVEFMTPSVTSVNIAEAVGAEDGLLARVSRPLLSRLARAMNPHFRYFDSHHWGYSVVEFSPDGCTFTVNGVDKDSAAPTAPRRPLARFYVPTGQPRILRRPV